MLSWTSVSFLTDWCMYIFTTKYLEYIHILWSIYACISAILVTAGRSAAAAAPLSVIPVAETKVHAK